MQIEIKNIGLAAFVKLRGYPLLEVGKYAFFFDLKSEKMEQDLRIDYFNSECSMHDIEVCNLRDMQRFVRERD